MKVFSFRSVKLIEMIQSHGDQQNVFTGVVFFSSSSSSIKISISTIFDLNARQSYFQNKKKTPFFELHI